MRDIKFNVKIQITKDSKDYIEFIKYNADILKSTNNVSINIVFWYNKNELNLDKDFICYISKLFNISENKIYDHYPRHAFKNCMFNILYSDKEEQELALKDTEHDSKFYLFYRDNSSFVQSIIELFSFIKAKLNYDMIKYETRNSYK